MVNYKLFWLEIFFQLPPIAGELYGDPRFNTFFEHKLNFSIVHRPNYPDLIDCVNDLEMDDISDNSVAFLNSLNRPIQNDEDIIQLARNLEVDFFNYNKLLIFPSEPIFLFMYFTLK